MTYPYQAFSEYSTSEEVTQCSSAQALADGALSHPEVNIQNIINADLTEMIVMFVRDTDNAYHTTAAATGKMLRQNGLLGAPVRDLELRLNGQTIIYYPGSAYLGSNQPLFCGAERLMITSLYQNTAATSNADIRDKASGVVSYVYKMILAQENPLLNEGEKMYNVPRYPNMTLQLRWKPEPDASTVEQQGEFPHAIDAKERYHVHCLQLYNGVWKLGEDMGSSELLTR